MANESKVFSGWLSPVMEQVKNQDKKKGVSFSSHLACIFDRYYALMGVTEMPDLSQEDEDILLELMDSQVLNKTILSNLEEGLEFMDLSQAKKDHIKKIIQELTPAEKIKLLEEKGDIRKIKRR